MFFYLSYLTGILKDNRIKEIWGHIKPGICRRNHYKQRPAVIGKVKQVIVKENETIIMFDFTAISACFALDQPMNITKCILFTGIINRLRIAENVHVHRLRVQCRRLRTVHWAYKFQDFLLKF